jgi:hypothetical protein
VYTFLPLPSLKMKIFKVKWLPCGSSRYFTKSLLLQVYHHCYLQVLQRFLLDQS